MGEIGITPGTFRYGLRWWEIKSIIRGYNARHHHGWEQARLVAYNARFCMGSKDPIPTVDKWITFPWEKEKVMPVSQDDIDELQAEMNAINAGLKDSGDWTREGKGTG